MLRLGSLFSGSGGFELAGTLCGIEPAWASEIEPFPIRVTRARFPDMKHYGDISQINGAEIEPVDLITGGSPCQSLSIAGKREGMSKKCPKCDFTVLGNEDITNCPDCGAELEYTKSGLFMEQMRIIKEMREHDRLEKLRSGRTNEPIRPRFMLWENVVGAFSSNKGEDFRAVLEETAKVCDKTASIPRPAGGKWNSSGCIMGEGYSIAWRVLDAQHWGIPQRRRRIALIADFGGTSAGEILFKREGLHRNFKEISESWQGVAGNIKKVIGITGEPYVLDFGRVADRVYVNCDKSVTLQAEAGGAGAKTGLYLSPKRNDLYCVASMQADAVIGVDISPTINASVAEGSSGPYITEKKAVAIQGNMIGREDKNGPQGSGVNEDVCFSLTCADRHGVAYCMTKGSHTQVLEEQSPTLMARDYKCAPVVNETWPDYIVRRLTPLECSRLQGFPDWWCDGLVNDNPTEDEMKFWHEVFETHRKIVTGASKPKTDKQIKKWLSEEPNDGAKYKMWGNGIALPCFLYVMEGIAEVLKSEKQQ